MSRLSIVALWCAASAAPFCLISELFAADDVIAPVSQRFASKETSEVPQFQQHVVPLLSRLGCNGRACHGSFQGQGGFRLSLFGYDFKLDHEGLTKGDVEKQKEPRVLVEEPEESLALLKATLETPHRGGKRMEVDSWQYNIFRNWIKSGAKSVPEDAPKFVRLEVTPNEIRFGQSGEQTQLRAIAVWSDGTREDVTPLCRFNSNDDLIAAVDADGLVKSGEVGDTHVVVNYDAGVVPIPVIRPVSDKTGRKYPKVETPTKIDELVIEKLAKLGIIPSEVCDDHEFLRRASLDLTGSLPAPQEVVDFLSNPDPHKRAKKIDELLERPGYAAWLTTKLCDFTGNNANNLQNVAGNLGGNLTQEWYDWIYQRVARNEPYDKLVEGIVVAKSRLPGESYIDYCQRISAMYGPKKEGSYADAGGLTYFWGRRNFRTTEERAIGFAYTFLGIRIQCAQCHKHPFDQWTQEDFNQFKNFFAGVSLGVNPKDRDEQQALLKKLGIDLKKGGNDARREIQNRVRKGEVVPVEELYVVKPQAPRETRNSKDKSTNNRNARVPAGPSAKLLGGDVVRLTEYDDPRQPLMDWLRDPNNRYFARAFVNRIWASMFNVGIVNPPDDMSLANAPSNAALLDYLSEQFIAHQFDMKWLHREIANSHTYQRSWKPNETNKHDQKNFSHAIPRRLPAEVALDALRQATLSDEEIARLQSDITGRAIAIPGTNGRNGNGNGNLSFALTVFGRSTRESNCDCDRSMEASLLQTVYMQNDGQIYELLNDNKGWVNSLAQAGKPSRNARSEKDVAKAKTALRNFEKSLEFNERALKRARQSGDENEIKDLEARIAELRSQIKKARQVMDDKPQETSKPVSVASLEPENLIKAAYLRSLSRYPTDSEIETSKKFLAQSEDIISGARDLLWALINTKEFILNH
jgi:hypothetical protein